MALITERKPAKGYKLTENRVNVLSVLLEHGPIRDDDGRAVRVLMGLTGHHSTQALSSVLETMERRGLVHRTMSAKRTYRIEALPAALTATDRRQLGIGVPKATPPSSPEDRLDGQLRAPGGARDGLSGPRVNVLRALLAGGPIDDPSGGATRLLLARTGQTNMTALSQLLKNMERAGLISRRVADKRTYRIEANPDALRPEDLDVIWSTKIHLVESIAALGARSNTTKPDDHALGLRDELQTAKAELAAAGADIARMRLQLEMFRTWAKRMPNFDNTMAAELTPGDPLPASAATPRAVAEARGAVAANERSAEPPSGRCRYVYSTGHAAPERQGQRCELSTWDGSPQWCWHHDPTPVPRRKAPIRRATTSL